jgi:hypothetical protein
MAKIDRYKDYHATIRKDGYHWVADLYKNGKPFMLGYMRFKTLKVVEQELKAVGVNNYYKRSA